MYGNLDIVPSSKIERHSLEELLKILYKSESSPSERTLASAVSLVAV
jgi:hypothetical protein